MPLRIPTAIGLLAFVLVSGMPFVLSLTMIWPFSFLAPLGGLLVSWTIGGVFGLGIGAVRSGAGGVFVSGIFCIFLAIGMLVAASVIGPADLWAVFMVIASSAFAGPLLVGIYGREKGLWLVRQELKAEHSEVLHPPSMPVSRSASPYPCPPEAQNYWEGRSKRGDGGR